MPARLTTALRLMLKCTSVCGSACSCSKRLVATAIDVLHSSSRQRLQVPSDRDDYDRAGPQITLTMLIAGREQNGSVKSFLFSHSMNQLL